MEEDKKTQHKVKREEWQQGTLSQEPNDDESKNGRCVCQRFNNLSQILS